MQTMHHHQVPRKTALITGAAGFIGSHLVERCLELGWRVIGVDSFTDYYAEELKRQNAAHVAGHPEYTLIEGDLLELDLLPILESVTTVFHLAAQAGVRASWDQFPRYTRLNIDASQKLLHAASRMSVERVVVASTSSVYGDAERLPTSEDILPRPVSPYGVTKVATEHLARLYWRSFGLATVCVRFFTVFGPRQRPDMAFNRLIARALMGRPFEIFGDGNQTRDFTYVADAVSGAIAAAEHGLPGSVYNVGGGSRRSLNSVVAALSDMLGDDIEVRHRDAQPGDARDTGADIRRARRELGFEPSVAFVAGLRDQLEWHYTSVASPQATR